MKCEYCKCGWVPAVERDGWPVVCWACGGTGSGMGRAKLLSGLSERVLRRIDAGVWRGGRGVKGTMATLDALAGLAS